MTARILDGGRIRDEIQTELTQEISLLKAAGIVPGLVAVLVGENPASQIYVRSKVKTCETLGLHSEKLEWPADTTTEQLLDLIKDLNAREDIDGILVQLPLPSQVDSKRVLLAVDPAKDVDGLHPVNVGNLVSGRAGLDKVAGDKGGLAHGGHEDIRLTGDSGQVARFGMADRYGRVMLQQ